MTPDDRSHRPQEAPPPTPRWVKVGAIVGAVVVLVLVLVAIFGGPGHGPGRHVPAGSPAAEATCDAEPYIDPGGTEVLSMSHRGEGKDSRDFGAGAPGQWNRTVERAAGHAGPFPVRTSCAR